MSTAAEPVRRRSPAFRILTAVVVLSAFVILLGLGTWQVQRLEWKEGLLARIDERIHAEPLPLGRALRQHDDMEYVPVLVEGEFLHEAERHVFTTWRGISGYNVYTPLVQDDGEAIFVNRGFVPYDRKDAITRAEGQVEGRVSIAGLARRGLAEKPSFIVPDNDPADNIFYWKDVRAMAETAGLPEDMPVRGLFVDADDTSNPGGMPVGGVTLIDLPNNHLQYVITWYGLALALAAVAGYRFWTFRRKP